MQILNTHILSCVYDIHKCIIVCCTRRAPSSWRVGPRWLFTVPHHPCLLRPTRQRSRSNICFIMRPYYLEYIFHIGQVSNCHIRVKMIKNSLLLFISHSTQNYRWYQDSSWIWKIPFCLMIATKSILCLESFCCRVLNDRPHWDGAFATTGGIFGDSDKSAPQTWFIGYGRARNRPFCINLDPR